MVGLRGVGKTVLLDRMRDDAEASGIHTLRIEAPEGRSLPALLAPELRVALLRLSRNEQAKALGERALRALAGFARALKVKFARHRGRGRLRARAGPRRQRRSRARPGGAARDGRRSGAERAGTALVLFIDELAVREGGRARGVDHRVAPHRAAQAAGRARRRRPTAAARPHGAREVVRRAAVRLPGDRRAARRPRRANALVKPALDQGVEITEDALEQILVETHRYPYFLQEWGKHAWQVAERSPITLKDVRARRPSALAALGRKLLPGSVRSADARGETLRACDGGARPGTAPLGRRGDAVGRKVTSLAPIRNQLIAKGMIYSPSHGDTAFTVPLFDEFLRRVMPGDDWRE